MGVKKILAIQKAASTIVSHMDDEEIEDLKEWVEDSQKIIEDSTLSKKEKVKKLNKGSVSKRIIPVIKTIVYIIREHIWDNQSWARRIGAIGLLGGAATFGSQAAGLATMGMGVAIPLALITTTGGVVLGVFLDEINKELKKRADKKIDEDVAEHDNGDTQV